MSNYDDTQFNDYSVKNGLSDEEFDQDKLQLQIAFTGADWEIDPETDQRVYTNIVHEQYVDYVLSLWT